MAGLHLHPLPLRLTLQGRQPNPNLSLYPLKTWVGPLREMETHLKRFKIHDPQANVL